MAFGSRRSLFLLASALVCGCTNSHGEDAGTVPSAEDQAGSLALLQIERFSDAEAPLPRLVASAKVARYRAIEGAALLRLLGADAREVETCGTASRGAVELMPEARVEFLSVGDISLRGASAQHTLSPRLFPALATTASGFFYAGESEVSLPRAELDEYQLSARGENGVGAFEVALAAPADVSGLSVAGVPLEQGGALERGRDLEITWDPEDPSDRVELEIYAGGGVLSCAARDDGHFVVPSASVAAIEADDNAALVVRRVRVVAVDMQGIEAAYARVATTRTLALSVR